MLGVALPELESLSGPDAQADEFSGADDTGSDHHGGDFTGWWSVEDGANDDEDDEQHAESTDHGEADESGDPWADLPLRRVECQFDGRAALRAEV